MNSDFTTDITETKITLKVRLYKNLIKLCYKGCGTEGSGSNSEQVI